MKHRLVRVNELIKRELGSLIERELTFTQLVTVQEVDITPDLKQAFVYISVLGENPEEVLAKLHDRRKEFQHLLSRRVILKYTPHLFFRLDTTIERGSRIIDILQTLDIPEDEPEPGKPEGEHED
ncbi:MAG: 30S ribosome-binding factor RbfA [Chthoniobacteraceae bacterium]|nr:30S ribosome-binding factor RbfA [Chthoniobacteraceae bacterium]